MRSVCIVCKKSQMRGDTSRMFHKFPHDEEMRKKWMKATGINKVDVKCKVCSDHFAPEDYHSLVPGPVVRRLSNSAVPKVDHCDDSSDNDNVHRKLGNLKPKPENVVKSQEADVKKSSRERKRTVPNLSEYGEQQIYQNDSLTQFPEVDVLWDKHCGQKRKLRSSNKVPEDDITKSFRFRDGEETKFINRDEFVTVEAWEKFLRLMFLNEQKMEDIRQKLGKKVMDYQKIVEGIEDDEEEELCSPEKFLEVVLKE